MISISVLTVTADAAALSTPPLATSKQEMCEKDEQVIGEEASDEHAANNRIQNGTTPLRLTKQSRGTKEEGTQGSPKQKNGRGNRLGERKLIRERPRDLVAASKRLQRVSNMFQNVAFSSNNVGSGNVASCLGAFTPFGVFGMLQFRQPNVDSGGAVSCLDAFLPPLGVSKCCISVKQR